MFESKTNDSEANEISVLKPGKKIEGMDSLKKNIISCPSLLAGMSHEMRTYMNAIVAFSFLMKDSCKDGSGHDEYCHQIFKSSEQLIGLFDSFLDSAIIDTGSTKTENKVCKLDNLLEDLLSEFREQINKENQKDIELVTEIQFFNSIDISIDKYKILRIIRSLFENSLKNTNSGYIKIGYHYYDNMVSFYVLDSGQGYFKCKEFLHTEDLNESLLVHNDTYTAINITLAKKLVQMLGGAIKIECNGLTGSGVYFSIPAKMIVNPDISVNNYINTMIAI